VSSLPCYSRITLGVLVVLQRWVHPTLQAVHDEHNPQSARFPHHEKATTLFCRVIRLRPKVGTPYLSEGHNPATVSRLVAQSRTNA